MRGTLGYHLYACGRKGLPEQIELQNNKYRLSEVLKHDFFAATALYISDNSSQATEKSCPSKVVLKLSRQQHLLGLPLLWLGKLLRAHEVSIFRRLGHLEGIPRLLSLYGQTGFIYGYIEGCCLAEAQKLPDDFFDEFLKLLEQIHQCDVFYLDMNKRSNILLGSDDRPYLIDLQISLRVDKDALLWQRPSTYLRNALQRADLYHLFKHKRKLRPQLLRPQEQLLSRRAGASIRLHRFVATPLRKLRRLLLKSLYSNGLLVVKKNNRCSREDDPARFAD